MDGSASEGLGRRRLVDDEGRAFQVHVLMPPKASSAVLLLPAIAGPNEYIAERAQHLACAGHAVVVIDYVGRGEPKPDLSTPRLIDAAVGGLDDRRVLGDVAHAVAWLRSQGFAADRIGALGFCIGGTYAVLSAARPGQVACAVAYYGQLRYRERTDCKPVDPVTVASRLHAPLLGHFGDMDRLIDARELAEFGAQLRAAQRHHEIRTYAGAPHAFDEWFRPNAFRPVASAEAWDRTLIFFDWHLRQHASGRPAPGRPITQGD